MSATHVAITKQQVLALQALIDAGFAVVAFSPKELNGVNPRTLETQLARHGQSLIQNGQIASRKAERKEEKCYSRNSHAT